MKICFPIRDLNGKEFTSVEEVMGLINSELHGGWLLGANGLWHGGIHISDITQPHAALNNGAQDYGEPMPLQFMADGTIVAYRVNDVYQSAPYCNKPLRYSSTFALVKSLCQPDPKKETSWLEFYTLYMHLAAVEDYATSPCFKVSKDHNGISVRKYSKGQHGVAEDDSHPTYTAALNAPATVRNKLVNEGDRFVVSRTGRFYVTRNNKTTLLPFGLSRVLKKGKPSGEQYWITLDPELVERDGEMHNLMPEWMQQAWAKGTFNSVVNTDGSAAWQVKAGAPVGFMGLNEIPGTGSARVEQERYVHLEVLSTDSRMPGFLSNPGEVKTAGKLVRTLSGRKIWLRSAATPPVFTVTDATLSSGSLVSRERTTPFKDASDKWWFKVSDHGWMPQEDVEEIEQYDLLKQGFYPLTEESDGDMLHGFMEGWVPELFGRIAELTEGNKSSPLAGRVPEYYRTLIARLDENGDGEISADEIRRGLGRRDPAIRDIIDRLVVKHHSEWIGGPSEARWKGFYKILDTLSIPYCTQWQSGQEWMSHVEAFKAGKTVWHMHPVKFLNLISYKKTGLLKLDMLYKVFEGIKSPAKESFLVEFMDEINSNADIYKLDSVRRLNHFFAQVREEMGGAASPIEILNYSEEGLKETFRYFRNNPTEAKLYSYKKTGKVITTRADEVAIANRVYSNRLGNGSVSSGDGSRYRGRGAVHLTGKSNYQGFNDYYKTQWSDAIDFLDTPDKLEEAKYCVRSAVYFWLREELYTIADKGDGGGIVDEITAKVNLHTDSYSKRRGHFDRFIKDKIFQP